MGSTNGTFVNGTPLAPRKRHPLGPGDQLGIGPVALMVTRPATTGKHRATTAGMDLSGN